MPWSGPQFAKHNHSLSPAQAVHASKIANHVLASTGNEGIAIATANKLARRDDGGMVDPTSPMTGGMTPSVQTMNPQVRALAQRYAALPEEKLQELSARMGNSPQAAVIRRVLQQKRETGGTQPPMGMASGDGVQARAMGGPSFSEANPWWERQEASAVSRPAAGFLAGATPGRADSIRTTAPSGAYVIPADVMSGLGEGNSLAGAHVMDMILRSGPHGTPMPSGGRGMGMPRAPRPVSYQAKGGGVQDGKHDTTPVALSHGEYVVSPDEVLTLGGGDLKRGHRILDHFVVEQRRRQIAKLRKLPDPVGSKVEKKAA